MARPSPQPTELAPLVERVTCANTVSVLHDLVQPGADIDTLAAVAEVAARCTFDHEGVLVFTDGVNGVADFLLGHGFDVAQPVPSVIVRNRLAGRYGLSEKDVDVTILKGALSTPAGPGERRGVEVFCVPRDQATAEMVERECRENNEHHLALLVTNADDATLRRLRSVLVTQFCWLPDGGGYNPHDDNPHDHNQQDDNRHDDDLHDRARTSGRTVLYFRTPSGRRLELTCAGNYPEVVATHDRSTS